MTKEERLAQIEEYLDRYKLSRLTREYTPMDAVTNDSVWLINQLKNSWKREEIAVNTIRRIIRHANMEDVDGAFLNPHPLHIEQIAKESLEEIEKIV